MNADDRARRRASVEIGAAVGAVLACIVAGVLLVNLPVLHPEVHEPDEAFPIFATPTPTRDPYSVGTTPTPRDTVVPIGISSPTAGPSGSPRPRVAGRAGSDGTAPSRPAPVPSRPAAVPSAPVPVAPPPVPVPSRPSVPLPLPTVVVTPPPAPPAVPCIVSVLRICVRL